MEIFGTSIAQRVRTFKGFLVKRCNKYPPLPGEAFFRACFSSPFLPSLRSLSAPSVELGGIWLSNQKEGRVTSALKECFMIDRSIFQAATLVYGNVFSIFHVHGKLAKIGLLFSVEIEIFKLEVLEDYAVIK